MLLLTCRTEHWGTTSECSARPQLSPACCWQSLQFLVLNVRTKANKGICTCVRGRGKCLFAPVGKSVEVSGSLQSVCAWCCVSSRRRVAEIETYSNVCWQDGPKKNDSFLCVKKLWSFPERHRSVAVRIWACRVVMSFVRKAHCFFGLSAVMSSLVLWKYFAIQRFPNFRKNIAFWKVSWVRLLSCSDQTPTIPAQRNTNHTNWG